MSFEIQPLTKDAEFFSNAERSPTTIEGSGQMVYWRDCFIRVYKAGNTEKPTATYDTCNGQGTVQKGTSLLFLGKNGKVKEET